jgi:hypothetical protein
MDQKQDPFATGDGRSNRQTRITDVATAADVSVSTLQDRSHSLPAEAQRSRQWEKLHPGDRVYVTRSGFSEGEAVIDSMMPDFSAVWLLMFNGTGRFMVLSEDDVRLEASGRA